MRSSRAVTQGQHSSHQLASEQVSRARKSSSWVAVPALWQGGTPCTPVAQLRKVRPLTSSIWLELNGYRGGQVLGGKKKLEPVCFPMSSSKCFFLTCIQISQEAYQVVWYSHLFKNFQQFVLWRSYIFKSFASFKIELLGFMLSSCKSSLYIVLDNNPYWVYDLQLISPIL